MMKKRYLIVYLLFVSLLAGVFSPELLFSSEWETLVFPDVTGWKRSAKIQTFSPKTLFEYIDGAADLYLTYDFEELKVAEYQNEKKASVTVDVYFHKTPTTLSESIVRSVFRMRTLLKLGLRDILRIMSSTF